MFSEVDFDPVKWLNTIFYSESESDAGNLVNENNSLDSKEMIASNMVYKLQLMVEETNNSLEDIAQRMSLSIPKVIGEAEVLNREAAELCSEVVDVRTKMICAVQQSSEAVESLVQLDQAKQRLQKTYKALQEANNWTTLTLDVDEVFETGDIDQIAEKLANMQKSLEVLSLSSSLANQHQDKSFTLEKLKDRFEKLIEPVLVDSFLNQTSRSIEFYSKLFKDLHRSDRLLTYYHHCLRDQLLKEWTTQVKLDSEETLLDWLNFLYDRLSAIWKTQMNFCMKVLYPEDFGQSLKILCDIYTDIIMSLDPTIETCFEQHLERSFTTATGGSQQARLVRQNALIQLKQFTNSFMRSIEQNIIDQYSGPEKANEFIPRVSSFDIFIRTIYRPFATFNEVFLQLEKDRLFAEFDEMKAKYTETANMFVSSECVIKLFVTARNALKIYSQFVQSYPILGVDCAIEPFLLRFFLEFRCFLQENITRHLSRKEASTAIGSSATAASSSHRRNNSAGNLPKLQPANSNSSSHGTGTTAPNWQVIQQAFFTFQIVGEFFLQLDKFQQQIHLSFQESQHQLQDSLSSAVQSIDAEKEASILYFNRFDIFILNLDSNIELRDQIQGHLQSPPPCSTILPKVQSECVKAARTSAQAICDSVLDFVHVHLSNFIATLRSQLNSNLASTLGDQQGQSDDELSFSPNEYITQIGQYLLTLPQHLEPFNPNENAAMKSALKNSVDVFTGSGKDDSLSLHVSKLSPSHELDHSQLERIETATTELLLDSILRLTTRAFLQHILKLSPILSLTGAKSKRILPLSVRKQIAVDLDYLVRVCEDLGLTSNDPQFLLLVQVFNDVQSRDAFQQVLLQNATSKGNSKMLQTLNDILFL